MLSTPIKSMTIDLEDWFHCMEPNPSEWDKFDRRVEIPTEEILKALDEYDCKATFFVLGDVAKQNPSLIRKISDLGHDIGSHGTNHEFVYSLTPEQFDTDIKNSLDVLENITGKKVVSYRAPYFSITQKSMWGLEVLKANGITVDSSIFPVINHRYGIKDFPIYPHEVIDGVYEFPITIHKAKIGNIPFAGGVYFRFLPVWLNLQLIEKTLNAQNYFLFYIHPWEFDPEQPRHDSGSKFLNFRHYYNLDKALNKYKTILSKHKFVSLADAYASLKKNG